MRIFTSFRASMTSNMDTQKCKKSKAIIVAVVFHEDELWRAFEM
ncbi:hypothetical protein PC129_g5357 [Phytophthora cactorum]|uniref:Uncharacterized protein n=1 Tax=Phytophthora cactorum TaxID=29920 RepID=A0A8T1IFC6_9STRA|nr:hypothetical protein PC120_g14476 [Phytophthora cactorum]KAG3223985.1 hypothetical protein PC129_g5357 [Phytophthora cactorum]KAG4049506.1 hypothetical protein PC123_g15215 [Phytophthora cactorum]